MNYNELEQEVKRLEEQIKVLRVKLEESFLPYQPYGVKVPDDIETYYTTDIKGRLQKVGQCSRDIHEHIYKCGGAFETSESALSYYKERLLLKKLEDWADWRNGDWYPDWENGDDKFSIYYFHNTESFSVCSDWNCNSFSELPYFKSEELAREFIEEFGDEIKEVLL